MARANGRGEPAGGGWTDRDVSGRLAGAPPQTPGFTACAPGSAQKDDRRGQWIGGSDGSPGRSQPLARRSGRIPAEPYPPASPPVVYARKGNSDPKTMKCTQNGVDRGRALIDEPSAELRSKRLDTVRVYLCTVGCAASGGVFCTLPAHSASLSSRWRLFSAPLRQARPPDLSFSALFPPENQV